MVVKAKPVAPKVSKPVVAKSESAKPKSADKVEHLVPETRPTKEDKPKKLKMVRDSFTMPQDEYAQIATLKARCLKAGVGVKKSELLRAALVSLAGLADKKLLTTLAGLKKIKTGRPIKA